MHKPLSHWNWLSLQEELVGEDTVGGGRGEVRREGREGGREGGEGGEEGREGGRGGEGGREGGRSRRERGYLLQSISSDPSPQSSSPSQLYALGMHLPLEQVNSPSTHLLPLAKSKQSEET